MNRPILFGALASSTLLSLNAVENALPPGTAQTITVTAPKESVTAASTDAAAEQLSQVPGGTQVIPAKEYLQGRAVTLHEVFAESPGVYARSREGSEEARLSIRGSGIQRTFHLRGIMLLQDGQPINQADGNGDFQSIEPAALDHVEIYRGANALEYGASTLGGAINFVSPSGYTAVPARARAEGGSFGFIKGLASTAGQRDSADGYLAATAYRRDGFRAHSEQENERVFGNVGYRFPGNVENRVYLSYINAESELAGSLTKGQMEDDPRQANPGSVLRNSRRDFPLYRVADRVSFLSGSERFDVDVGYMRKELFHPLAFGLIDQDSDDWSGTARFTSDAPWFGEKNRIVLGANGYWGRTEARQFGYAGPSGNERGAIQSDAIQTARTIELFTEIRHAVVERWWSIAGAQGTIASRDFNDRILANGDQSDSKTYHGISPKVGVLHEATEHIQDYANVSRSFEPPTFSEYVQRDVSGFTRPQPDLDAQTAWTAEIGTRGSVEAVAWDVTLYHAWLRDEYLSYQVAPGLTQTINAEETTHAGVELGLNARLLTGLLAADDRLVLAQTYTYGRFRFVDDAVYGNGRIPGLPEHVWRGELRWECAGWYAGPVLDLQSGWPVDFDDTLSADAAFLLGARAGYQTDHGFSAYLEGKNLLDEIYAATTGIANPAAPADAQSVFNPGDGLAIYGGVEWSY